MRYTTTQQESTPSGAAHALSPSRSSEFSARLERFIPDLAAHIGSTIRRMSEPTSGTIVTNPQLAASSRALLPAAIEA